MRRLSISSTTFTSCNNNISSRCFVAASSFSPSPLFQGHSFSTNQQQQVIKSSSFVRRFFNNNNSTMMLNKTSTPSSLAGMNVWSSYRFCSSTTGNNNSVLGFLSVGNMNQAILKGLVKSSATLRAAAAAANQSNSATAAAPTSSPPPANTAAKLCPGDGTEFIKSLNHIIMFDPSFLPGTKKTETLHNNLKKLNPHIKFEFLATAKELAERSHVCVLGLKPQVARDVLHPLRGSWGKKIAADLTPKKPLVCISVIAGESINLLEEMLLPVEASDKFRREEAEMQKAILEYDDHDVMDYELFAEDEPASTSSSSGESGSQGESTSSSSSSSQAHPEEKPTHLAIARTMPNTPLLVGQGVSGYALAYPNLKHATGAVTNAGIPKETTKYIHDCVAAVLGTGRNVLANVNEDQLEAVTGVSGCGPAFVSMVVEAMADAGVVQGLPRPLANRLAAETVHGSAAMLSGENPAIPSAVEMRHQVCSPGGATIVGVHTLEEKGLRDALMCAVRASSNRCAELRVIGENKAEKIRKTERAEKVVKAKKRRTSRSKSPGKKRQQVATTTTIKS